MNQVLRIWDTHLQVCLQRLSGMFPKGPAEGKSEHKGHVIIYYYTPGPGRSKAG